jgi:hypothetical protein
MPLSTEVREQVDQYCKRDLPGDLPWHISKFAFVPEEDIELRKRLGRAFYTARYVGKLMEAVYANGNELHPFVKFQIMQYASIYEAVITYTLWKRFKDHSELKALETHKSYKPVQALGSATKVKFGDEDIFTCVYRDARTPRNSIPFGDKVDCAVRIGFVDIQCSEEIKRIYQLRNLAHIENEADKQIEVEIEQAKMAYWRMQPFLDKIGHAWLTEPVS